MKTRSAVVIGAGVGGIAAATHLARRGLQVTVFEKNARPGGRLDHFWREGHHFDVGPTLFIMPRVYEAEFALLGAALHEELDLLRVDPTYTLVFDDGLRLPLTSDAETMRRELESIESGSFQSYLRYMEEGARHYRLAMEHLVERDPRRLTDLLSPRTLAALWQVSPLRPHYDHMRTFFDDPRLKAAFTFQDIYMGLSPFEAPATFSMMPYTELADGVWFPRGGMYQVVEALMGLARRAGVEFVFNAAVEQIEVERGRVRRVHIEGGRQVAAEAVLANADLPYVYQRLLPHDHLAESIAHKRFSGSVISFFWGLDRRAEGLGPHTLFLSDDFRGDFDRIEHHLPPSQEPSLYLHAPSRIDACLAPPGQDTLVAIVPVGHIVAADRQDWGEVRDLARQAVFRRLAKVGHAQVESHIKFEVSYTPLSWKKRYNLMNGATHGLSHALTQLSYFRPSNRHPRYRNLYFVGASTRPGTGVPTAMISARLTSARMLEDMGL